MTPAVVWDVLDLNLLWQIKYLGDKRSAGYNFIVRDNSDRADFTFFRADNMPILERRGGVEGLSGGLQFTQVVGFNPKSGYSRF